ncbi:hypothetical protein DM860_002147 [Cuscuta australis]|uniref:Pectate lyase superfamily protein domain-containing protein n=1 Tax=Cuscuta australis TaxID=267555 RepID=A0A328DX45_9ASTE|nr:hypothetical protein DM860_002147 [Cuscuta australis]
MGSTFRHFLCFSIVILTTCFDASVHGEIDHRHKHHASRIKSKTLAPLSPETVIAASPRVYHVASYGGADPTGVNDSTDAIRRAIGEALQARRGELLYTGIQNLGGVRVDLDGGVYAVSQPLQLPPGTGNFVIHGGTLKASDDFPTGESYLIDLSAGNGSLEYNFEFVTFRDLFLNSNLRGGGIRVVNSLRISVDNCYITGFTSEGISVAGGHETYIRNSFLGQHITAGHDPGESHFGGTAISLSGNDNAVTDVVIFSAAIGILISGQANILTGVHCYNKATGFGGTGVYLKTPGLTQTRIVNSYFDYTGIVAEDPVQLQISNCFFLGDAFILFKSVNGVINGVNVADNIFSGSSQGDIVRLDESKGSFKHIDQVTIDRNNARGMNIKSTIARAKSNNVTSSTSWKVDLNHILLFPNRTTYVEYTFVPSGDSFPKHALKSVSNNLVVVESDVEVVATVFVMAQQGNSH